MTRLSWLSIAFVALAVSILLGAISPPSTIKVARGSRVWHAAASSVLVGHSSSGGSLAVAERHSRHHWRRWCRTRKSCLAHHWWVRYPRHSHRARRAWCRYKHKPRSCWIHQVGGPWQWGVATAYVGDASSGGSETACQTSVFVGEVAADLRYWRCGERLFIQGIGPEVVLDSGGDIVGPGRFDIAMSSEDAANAWGIRNVRFKRLN